MKWFYVAYELRDDKRDYGGLWDELHELKARRILPSIWFIRAHYSTSSKDLAECIGKHLGHDDRLLVVESSDSKWRNPVNNPLAQQSGAATDNLHSGEQQSPQASVIPRAESL